VTGDPSHALLNSKGSVPAALRHIADQHCQFVLVSATMPASLVKKLRRLLPNLVSVSTSVVHRPPSKLKQNFILVGNQNKIELLGMVFAFVSTFDNFNLNSC
jgi:superfamily II DNA/RNA helicase